MDQQMDQRADGQTEPLVEIRGRIQKPKTASLIFKLLFLTTTTAAATTIAAATTTTAAAATTIPLTSLLLPPLPLPP